MLIRSSVLLYVIEHAIRNLQHGLVDDVLVRSMGSNKYPITTHTILDHHLLNAKLQLLEALGQLINQLLLERAFVGRHLHKPVALPRRVDIVDRRAH
jgi:hypothetical protein